MLGLIVVASAGPARSADAAKTVYDVNRRLGRGVNLGNALEAPREGDWGASELYDAYRARKGR
jgi:endoglucanase